MKTFMTIWSGNLVSLFGSGMVRFAFMIWMWQKTGKATSMALLGFCYLLFFVLTNPFAGIVADRFSRKGVMISSYVIGAFVTLGVYALTASSQLVVWHLYAFASLGGIIEAVYTPAYIAATTMIVPKKEYARISGLQSFERSLSEVVAPLTAGLLLVSIGLKGILLMDMATFVIAIAAHVIVLIPPTPSGRESSEERQNTGNDFTQSLRYIADRKGLLGMLLVSSGSLLVIGFIMAILPAMILARSGGNNMALAMVMGAPGIGGIVGSILVSLWGGPKKRIHSCLWGSALYFIIASGLTAIGRTIPLWIMAGFGGGLFFAFILAGSQAIWQSKVEPHMQGRIFAASMAIRMAPILVGFLFSGYLADHLFEPALAQGTALSHAFRWLLGTGPGTGMALMFLIAAVMGTALNLAGYLFPSVRNVETELADHTLNLDEVSSSLSISPS